MRKAEQSSPGATKVTNVMSYKDALTYARGLDILLIPYELAEGMKETKQVIEEIKRGQSVGIFIGPEGGFETQEVEDAIANGARAITLGKRILRTETAGLTTLSILMYHITYIVRKKNRRRSWKFIWTILQLQNVMRVSERL